MTLTISYAILKLKNHKILKKVLNSNNMYKEAKANLKWERGTSFKIKEKTIFIKLSIVTKQTYCCIYSRNINL